jgi:hypothetical protein
MYAVVGYQYQNGCPTVVPETPMQLLNGLGGDSVDLLEVDQWRMVRAQHSIDLEQLERPAEQMCLRSCRPKIFRADDESRRNSRGYAEVRLQQLSGSSG